MEVELTPLKIRAFEIFSCAGGMGEGFRRAGIEFQFAFDRSSDACDSYEANLGHRPVQMDVNDLLRLARDGWRPPPLDLVVADPPCTPWSVAGKMQGLEDERDCMRATIELIRRWRPRAYLIGNVPGLDSAKNRPVMDELLAPLARDGYCVKDFVRLNAADFGVAQCRRRPFWFGHLGGTCIVWPTPTHHNPQKAPLLTPWVTSREALAVLPASEWGQPRWLRRRQQHPMTKLNEPARTVTCHDTREGNHLEWPWDRPATTVCARPEIGPPGRRDLGEAGKGSQVTHPNSVRLSERAAAVLQGFHPNWRFCGSSKTKRWQQIGQAMPPPMAHAVASRIVAWFESQGGPNASN